MGQEVGWSVPDTVKSKEARQGCGGPRALSPTLSDRGARLKNYQAGGLGRPAPLALSWLEVQRAQPAGRGLQASWGVAHCPWKACRARWGQEMAILGKTWRGRPRQGGRGHCGGSRASQPRFHTILTQHEQRHVLKIIILDTGGVFLRAGACVCARDLLQTHTNPTGGWLRCPHVTAGGVDHGGVSNLPKVTPLVRGAANSRTSAVTFTVRPGCEFCSGYPWPPVPPWSSAASQEERESDSSRLLSKVCLRTTRRTEKSTQLRPGSRTGARIL